MSLIALSVNCFPTAVSTARSITRFTAHAATCSPALHTELAATVRKGCGRGRGQDPGSGTELGLGSAQITAQVSVAGVYQTQTLRRQVLRPWSTHTLLPDIRNSSTFGNQRTCRPAEVSCTQCGSHQTYSNLHISAHRACVASTLGTPRPPGASCLCSSLSSSASPWDETRSQKFPTPQSIV